MSLPQFNEIKGLSNLEISTAVIKAEKELFNLKFIIKQLIIFISFKKTDYYLTHLLSIKVFTLLSNVSSI